MARTPFARAATLAGVLLLGIAAGACARDRFPGSDDAASSGQAPVVSAEASASPPLAFRYQGKLCSVRGCLLTTVDRLCGARGVERLLVRVESVPDSVRVQATLLAVPSAEGVGGIGRSCGSPGDPSRRGEPGPGPGRSLDGKTGAGWSGTDVPVDGPGAKHRAISPTQAAVSSAGGWRGTDGAPPPSFSRPAWYGPTQS